MVKGLTGEPVGSDLTIGVIGPHDLVEHVMLMGQEGAVPSRLVAAAYSDERQAAERVAALGPSVDVCLFTGPLPYEVARRSGALSMPATYVPPVGTALYGALLRAAKDGAYDPTRISIDGLPRTEVEDVYADLDLESTHVHVDEASVRPDFHVKLWRRGTTTAAVTCVRAVAQQLRRLSVPTVEVRPTRISIRSALNSAALLGAATKYESAQIAVGIVDVPTLREVSQPGAPRYWREELRLTVHRLLLDEARRTGLLVWSSDDHSYLVAATAGSIASATRGFRTPPFVERVQTELGVSVEVGIGLGATAQEAETHARTGLSSARGSRGKRWFVVDRTGRAFSVPAQGPVRRGAGRGAARTADPKGRAASRGRDALARLADALEGQGDRSPTLIVDAETAARSLGVTQRTARRVLRGLVEEGLAWPLSQDRPPKAGRPRQHYRLLREKLDT